MRRIRYGFVALVLLHAGAPRPAPAQGEAGPRVVPEVWAPAPAAFGSSPLSTDSGPAARQERLSVPARDPAVLRCEGSEPENRCEGKLRLGSIVGAGIGVGAAMVFCAGRSCEVAGFALMLLGGVVGSEIGDILQCGWGRPPAPRRPP